MLDVADRYRAHFEAGVRGESAFGAGKGLEFMVSLHVCVLEYNHQRRHRLSTGFNNIQHNIQQWELIGWSFEILSVDPHPSNQLAAQTEEDRGRKINKVVSQTDGSEGIQSLRLKETHSRMFSFS